MQWTVVNSSISVCSGHGICNESNLCVCSPGWSGVDCELKLATVPSPFICFGKNSSDTNVCNSRGDCISDAVCSCSQGYGGIDCSLSYCGIYLSNHSSVCSGHGECVDTSTCNCDQDYVGLDCELFLPHCFGIPSSSPSVCNYGLIGTCVSHDNCTCLSQVDIDGICNIPVCFGVVASNKSVICSGRGQCVKNDTCHCTDNNYGGTACQVHNCFGVLSDTLGVCSSKGSCSAVNYCECMVGYSGNDCSSILKCGSVPFNQPKVCSGHGSCVAPLDTCQCSSGYIGTYCDQGIECFGIPANNASVCSGHGQCTITNTCSCESGYSGEVCSNPYCFGILGDSLEVCSGRGVCSDHDICSCQSGFAGTNCQTSTQFKPILYPSLSIPEYSGPLTLNFNASSPIFSSAFENCQAARKLLEYNELEVEKGVVGLYLDAVVSNTGAAGNHLELWLFNSSAAYSYIAVTSDEDQIAIQMNSIFGSGSFEQVSQDCSLEFGVTFSVVMKVSFEKASVTSNFKLTQKELTCEGSQKLAVTSDVSKELRSRIYKVLIGQSKPYSCKEQLYCKCFSNQQM